MSGVGDHSQASQPQAFQADVAKLLHLMVHSVYSDRDVFLRELLSNAADACEKLRYEALKNAALAADSFVIRDFHRQGWPEPRDRGQWRRDVAREDLERASRHDRTFRNESFSRPADAARRRRGRRRRGSGGDGAARKKLDLIGQFGDRLLFGLHGRRIASMSIRARAGSNEAFVWSSDGKGTFTIAPVALDEAPVRERGSFSTQRGVQGLSRSLQDRADRREHSSALTVPIELIESPGAEPRRISRWRGALDQTESAIKSRTIREFLPHDLGMMFDEPRINFALARGGTSGIYGSCLCAGLAAVRLSDPWRARTRQALRPPCADHGRAEVLPRWLRFVRLVVDSADLPLNVSREMIQESPVFAAIKKAVANRVLQELVKLSESDKEKFAKVWKHFGAVLKEGLYEDPERRDALFDLARFATSTSPEGGRTLKEYVAGLQPNQTAIYYLLGEDLARLAASPQLEGFQARGIEVLLLPDHVDAFWTTTAVGFDGKPFKSVTQAPPI